MIINELKAKPFLKWAGGKGKLIKEISQRIPNTMLKDDKLTYIEPFLGSGAFMFWILNNVPNVKKVIANDINTDLINCYKTIKNNVKPLIKALSLLEKEYLLYEPYTDNRKKMYLDIRDRFNSREYDIILHSAYFIFLNKTCFNGLYRVNNNNLFNVPQGSYTNPTICDSENLFLVNKVIQNVTFTSVDFSNLLFYIDKNTLVYLDPPYKPISKTASFTSYSKSSFNDEAQIRLKLFCDKIDSIGAKWIQSNSDVRNIDKDNLFFDNLYKDYKISRIQVKRVINSKATSRGYINELIIENRGKTMECDNFYKTMTKTTNSLEMFVNFPKIFKNIEENEIHLNTLNFLLNKDNMEQAVKALYKLSPKSFEILDLLIAVSKKNNLIVYKEGDKFLNKQTTDYLKSPTEILYYLEKTGLTKLFQSGKIKNLVDYTFGVEVGLDSNTRKNRTGKIMEKIITKIFSENNLSYETQVKSKNIHELDNYPDFEKIDKIFDFVVRTKKNTYLIETNFYNSGGSKLNEVCRSYTNINQNISNIEKVEFVWITDGNGWNSTKKGFKEAFSKIKHVYNLNTMKNFINILREES